MQTPLQFLSFFNNSLSGNVSSSFCNMPSLAYLDLRANKFSGEGGRYQRKANSLRYCMLLLLTHMHYMKRTVDVRICQKETNTS